MRATVKAARRVPPVVTGTTASTQTVVDAGNLMSLDGVVQKTKVAVNRLTTSSSGPCCPNHASSSSSSAAAAAAAVCSSSSSSINSLPNRGGVSDSVSSSTVPSPPPFFSHSVEIDGHTDSNHDTALTLSCAGGHEELVTLLLSRSVQAACVVIDSLN